MNAMPKATGRNERRKRTAKMSRQTRAGKKDLRTDELSKFLRLGMNDANKMMPNTCEFDMRSDLLSELNVTEEVRKGKGSQVDQVDYCVQHDGDFFTGGPERI